MGYQDFAEHGAFFTEIDAGDIGASGDINWINSNKQKLTVDTAAGVYFTNPPNAGSLLLNTVQGPLGSGTVTWPTEVKWGGGTAPTLTATSGAVDIVSLYWDGTSYYGQSALNFS